MRKLLEVLARERCLWQQKRELQVLRSELEALRTQNERMRAAMRRCLTCEYRIRVEDRG